MSDSTKHHANCKCSICVGVRFIMDDSFGFDLPPVEYSATVDMCQDTIAKLESRVRELESCKEEATKRVIEHAKNERRLKAELFEARQAIFREGISAEEYKAERDRLKEDVKLLELYLENTRKDKEELRASHAALVEEVKSVADSLFPGPLSAKLKAALAEVKG